MRKVLWCVSAYRRNPPIFKIQPEAWFQIRSSLKTNSGFIATYWQVIIMSLSSKHWVSRTDFLTMIFDFWTEVVCLSTTLPRLVRRLGTPTCPVNALWLPSCTRRWRVSFSLCVCVCVCYKWQCIHPTMPLKLLSPNPLQAKPSRYTHTRVITHSSTHMQGLTRMKAWRHLCAQMRTKPEHSYAGHTQTHTNTDTHTDQSQWWCWLCKTVSWSHRTINVFVCVCMRVCVCVLCVSEFQSRILESKEVMLWEANIKALHVLFLELA